ncbi:MAG: hypothetical protein NT074_00900 [Methanomicrobiales archaeon]|nr:hypothetical protein [Methanomicrobiales archaeon]
MKRFPIVLLLAGLLVVPSFALNITADVGETWVQWSWEANQTTTIYVDSLFRVANTTRNYTAVTDASPSEEHRLSLYDVNGTLVGESVATTLPPTLFILALLVIAIFFAVLTLLMKNIYRVLLCAVICTLVSLYLTQVSVGHLIGVSIIGVLLSILSGVVVILVLADMRTGEEED